jgi:hypothetical protein
LENFLTDEEIKDMKSSASDIVDQLDPESHRCVFEAMGVESEVICASQYNISIC